MSSISFRDIEQLCAYLDGELSESEQKRMAKRINSDPALAARLDEIRETRQLLQTTPKRRAPRNFTLTPKMAGIRPPVPRLVPVFSWASAAATLVFIFTLGAGLFRQLSIGTTPLLAAAPSGLGGGPAAAATQAPALAAPATAAPALPRASDQAVTETPNVQAFAVPAPQETPPAAAKESQHSEAGQKVLTPWLVVFAGLGVLFAILALLFLWTNQIAFRRKNRQR